jgi:zinc resistance-associated protein
VEWGVGMRRKKAFKRGRVIPILAAGAIAYLANGWHITALRSTDDLTAADAVATRFPQQWANLSPVNMAAVPARDDAQAALFSPVPMIPAPTIPAPTIPQAPQHDTQQAAAPQGDDQITLQTAALDLSPPAPSVAIVEPQPLKPVRPRPVAAKTVSEHAESASAAAQRRVANRPGYMLDDAQIASIKTRLHLTPDQEDMWPAVEAALRNMAYTHTPQTRGRNAPATAQAAAVDPDSVQGLKSAAVPLIMSFNAEQKEEVRNLVHVMGLDQLASQF